MPHSAAFDLVLHCLPMSYNKEARLTNIYPLLKMV